VRAAASAFVGDIEQVPSTVSAIKVGGKRAHALAREGREVALEARPVTVHRLDVGAVRAARVDGTPVLDVDVDVHCSTGTYVRALARDLGAALGLGGHLTRLRRTAVGPVGADEAIGLEVAEEAGRLDVVPLEEAVPRFFRCRALDEEQARDVSFGRALDLALPGDGRPVALTSPEGRFLALYRADDATTTRAVAVAVFVP
jgi:tRNA pseudouridine55 synthase